TLDVIDPRMDLARQFADQHRFVTHRLEQHLFVRGQFVLAVTTDQLPVGPGELPGPRQLDDPQMSPYGKVQQAGGDVDRVDPLIGDGADMAGSDLAEVTE